MEARKQLANLHADRAGGQKVTHTADSTAKSKFGDCKLKEFEAWRKDMTNMFDGRQAYSEELGVIMSLAGHPHGCVNWLVRVDKQSEFNAWASKEDLTLYGVHRITLDTEGNPFPVSKEDPYLEDTGDALDPAVAIHTLVHTSESDKAGDDKRGPGSGLKGDDAHPPYCQVRTRRRLAVLLQAHPSFFMYAPISVNHQRAILDLIGKNVDRNRNPMQCIVPRMDANVTWSGSQIWDWLLQTYNKEQPMEIFEVIRSLFNIRPGNVPWTIYAHEVKRKFDELKNLLASTKGNLTDWWQLMLWH